MQTYSSIPQSNLVSWSFIPLFYDSQHVVTNLEICISSEGNEWMRCRKFAKRGHLRLKLLWPINYPQPSLFAKLIRTSPKSTVFPQKFIKWMHVEFFLVFYHFACLQVNMAICLVGKHHSENYRYVSTPSFPVQKN